MKRMKNALVFCGTLILAILLIIPSFAHPGRTDSKGGHTNHSTGEYHYHHGYPEHQHPNGVCPYDKKAAASSGISSKTPNPSTSASSSSTNTDPKEALSEWKEKYSGDELRTNEQEKQEEKKLSTTWVAVIASVSSVTAFALITKFLRKK